VSGRSKVLLVWLGALSAGWLVGRVDVAPSPGRLSFLAVGQGDCTVIRHGEITVLVDAGPATERFDAGSRIVAPKLREMGVGVVDLLILTHPDADHIGGLPGLASRVRIERVAASARFRNHPDLIAALQRAKIGSDRVQWVAHPLILRHRKLALEIREPSKKAPVDSDNEGSLFIRVAMGRLSAVMTGDAGFETEIIEAGRGDWRAGILKAGHHGSANSTSDQWLAEVRPKAVVVSCGAGNPFGHPSPLMLARASRAGTRVFRTDLHGDVHFEPSAEGFVRVKQ
jgi:competence protein ComEC